MAPRLAIVLPCYNESQVLASTLQTVSEFIDRLADAGKISTDSFLVSVDDGSRDETWQQISRFHASMPGRFKGIKLSGNVGQQRALLAGLHYVRGKVECAVSIDADLQDDFRAIELMLDAFKCGAEVVYGVRRRRDSDGCFKRWTALAFYRVMRVLGMRIIENHADFRLLGSKALECLSAYRETNIFLRGIVPLMGFSTKQILYDRHPRKAGQSKYSPGKMFSLALDGLTSFSPAPLRLISITGAVLFMFSVIAATYALVGHFRGNTVVGWTSVAISLYMLGGIQLLAIGIIGEYLSKMYLEVKHRPAYFVERELP